MSCCFRPVRSIGTDHGNHTQRIEPSSKGPETYFSGSVRVDPLFQVGDTARLLQPAGGFNFKGL
jgi:hypothetical protein